MRDLTPSSKAGAPDRIQAGTPEFRRANLALVMGGFTTFALLYTTQPILPLLATEFDVSPARVSLTVSAGTGALALALIPASILADRFGRDTVMKIAFAAAGVFALASAWVTTLEQLLWLRALLGLALAGLPAVAMTWLSEEIAPAAQSRVMGWFIAGNAVGGMSGRFVAAALTDLAHWRLALAALGLFGIVAALAFWRFLPPSRHFSSRAATPHRILRDARIIFSDSQLPWLFLTAFLIMGAFVGLYNYLGFRVYEAPFNLGPTAIGALFSLYLVGSYASAWSGRLSDLFGRDNVVWMMTLVMAAGLLLTLPDNLPIIILGAAVFTFGYFATHTAASSWVAIHAGEQRALATALYLSSYYLGSSILGAAGGLAWGNAAWPGTVAMLLTCSLAAFLVALWLRTLRGRQ